MIVLCLSFGSKAYFFVKNRILFATFELKFLIYILMKKRKNYGAYIFAALYSTMALIANKFFLKPGFILRWILYYGILVGIWHLIDWLLNLPNHKFLRWIYTIVGISMYIFTIAQLDLYVFHLLIRFAGFSVWDFYAALGISSIGAIIFIESIRWMREREKAEIENLTLQAENIEANFQLLKEQVNPDFLFYCLNQLKMMAKTDDPNMENYILKLADVYRQFLKKDTNSHFLRKELALFQSYMFLMCYGRETILSFEVKVSDAALEQKIPVFALQMLADNYIKHHDFLGNKSLHFSIFQKEAESITITHTQAHKITANSMDTEQLAMCYAFEGIENGLRIEKEANIYSFTLSLF